MGQVGPAATGQGGQPWRGRWLADRPYFVRAPPVGLVATVGGGILLARWLADSLCCARAEARARPPLLLAASFILHARENDTDSVTDGADSDTNFAHSDDSKIDVDSLLLLVLLESCVATGSCCRLS